MAGTGGGARGEPHSATCGAGIHEVPAAFAGHGITVDKQSGNSAAVSSITKTCAVCAAYASAAQDGRVLRKIDQNRVLKPERGRKRLRNPDKANRINRSQIITGKGGTTIVSVLRGVC